MNNIDIQSTGFPGTNKTWRFIQEAFQKPFEGIAKAFGSPVILSGMDIIRTYPEQVAPGFLIFSGEILPFVQTNLTDTVVIIEEVESVDYNIDVNNDQVTDSLPAYKNRYAICGDGTEANAVTTFDFDTLKRLGDLTKTAFLNDVDDDESLLYMVCAGEIGFGGDRVFMRGKKRVYDATSSKQVLVAFNSEKLANNRYKITHGYGSLYYGITAMGEIPFQSCAVISKEENSITIEFISEGTTVHGLPSFQFLIYKTT